MPVLALRAALISVAALLLTTSAGCRYPKDMANSLETIRDGTVHVGVTENPPWVHRENEQAHGLEPALIKDLAKQLSAEIHWHWGTESEIIKALEQHQIHLAAGGFIQSSHLKRRVALTRPYFTTEYRVGFPSEARLPNELAGVWVGTRRLAGLGAQLDDEGAYPKFMTRLHQQDLPIASATWRLEAYELLVGPWLLSTEKHVLALPKGENAWMMEVQRFLNKARPLKEHLSTLALETPP